MLLEWESWIIGSSLPDVRVARFRLAFWDKTVPPMTRTKGKQKAAISSQRKRLKLGGSALNIWHSVFFVSGVAAMGLFQLALISFDHGHKAHHADNAANHAPGMAAQPWGELEIT